MVLGLSKNGNIPSNNVKCSNAYLKRYLNRENGFDTRTTKNGLTGNDNATILKIIW